MSKTADIWGRTSIRGISIFFTSFEFLAGQPSESYITAKTVIRLLYPHKNCVKAITTDNGCEFAAHLEITKKLSPKNSDKVIVYFADSYCF